MRSDRTQHQSRLSYITNGVDSCGSAHHLWFIPFGKSLGFSWGFIPQQK